MSPIFQFELQTRLRAHPDSDSLRERKEEALEQIVFAIQDFLTNSYSRKGNESTDCTVTLLMKADVFQSIFLPLLRQWQDKQDRKVYDCVATGEFM